MFVNLIAILAVLVSAMPADLPAPVPHPASPVLLAASLAEREAAATTSAWQAFDEFLRGGNPAPVELAGFERMRQPAGTWRFEPMAFSPTSLLENCVGCELTWEGRLGQYGLYYITFTFYPHDPTQPGNGACYWQQTKCQQVGPCTVKGGLVITNGNAITVHAFELADPTNITIIPANSTGTLQVGYSTETTLDCNTERQIAQVHPYYGPGFTYNIFAKCSKCKGESE